MAESTRFIIIDFCNFDDYPIGGYLSFAKNLMTSFGGEIALVGITTDKNDPIGKWLAKTIDGIKYDFFAIAFYSKASTKHFIPDRLACYYYLRKYRKNITNLKVNNVFIQRQEILLGTKGFGFNNTCYCFAGLENPLSVSKYWYSRFFARIFENAFFSSFERVNIILASGDEEAIQDMVSRSNGCIRRESVNQFPTRINTDIFKPGNKSDARRILSISPAISVVVTTGRLSSLKGWKLMIDSFKNYEKVVTGSRFYLIGEGEDQSKIEKYINENNLEEKVFLIGKQAAERVALYLKAADLFIMGSLKEGWSTTLIEAIACGVPCCVTNFSSAKSVILEGLNGFVVDEYNTDSFSAGMLKAVKIQLPVYNENVKAFAVNKLKEDLLKIWHLV